MKPADRTVSGLIRRYQIEVKGFGTGKTSVLNRLMLEAPIGKKIAADLQPADYIEHCRLRRKDVGAATVSLDICYLGSVFSYARVVWGMRDISRDTLLEVRPLLAAENLIATARRRKRRLRADEEAKLRAWFASYSRLPMLAIMEFALESTRRLGEVCSLRRSDYDREKQTCVVRKVKHPRHKDSNDKTCFLTARACEILDAQPVHPNDDRFFPYNSTAVGKTFARACRILKIENLRLHDLRGEGITRLFEEGYSVPEVQLFSLHDDIRVLMGYAAMRPEGLKNGPASKRMAA